MANPEWILDSKRLDDVTIHWPLTYEWVGASDWVDLLLFGFRQYVKVEFVDIPQEYKGTVVFRVVIGDEVRTISIGYSDYLPIDEACAESCSLYFKMQFDQEGYSFEHVVPGGYVPDGKRLYYYLSKLRRQKTKTFDVNGRFGLAYAREIREQAVDILSNQDKFEYIGGMTTVSYLEFLNEVARSKICIDMPGLGPFCFRLVNYLAIGSCVIAYPHKAILHTPLVDRKHIVYCKEDFSDLNDLCEYYLAHDSERQEIAQNAREFFDLNLHKDNLVRYYLWKCLNFPPYPEN